MQLFSWQKAAGAVLAILLASCGGGGGGGGGSSGLSVQANRSSLTFVGFQDRSAPGDIISFSLQGGSGTYYGMVVNDRPSVIQATFTPTSDTTATVAVMPQFSALAAGTSASGNLIFRLCRDVACNTVAWQQNFPYTIDIFNVTPTTLTFTGAEGATATAQVITVSPPDTARRLTPQVVDAANHAWLQFTRTSDSTFTVIPSAVGLRSGSYQGAVSLYREEGLNGSFHVPVAFTVGNGTVAPPANTIELDAEATTATTAGSFPVTFAGNQSPAWTASSNQPWLVLGSTGGTGNGSIPYSINMAALASLPNFTSASATVTLNAQGLSPVSFPITVNKRLPEVHTVWPSTLVVGRASTVKVSGRGFQQLNASRTLQVAGVGGVTAQVISDTEATLTLPATTAGGRTVSVANASGLASSTTQLVTIAAPTLAYATAEHVGEKRSSLYDASRTAVYAVDREHNAVVRYRYDGAQWQVATQPVASIVDIAMSPDQQTLYVGTGAQTLLALDPDTLQTRSTHELPVSLGSFNISRATTNGWAFTSDLRLWFGYASFTHLINYNLLDGEFSIPENQGSYFYGPVFLASGDRSRMLVGPALESPPRDFRYAPQTGAFTPVGTASINLDGVRIDGSGARMVDRLGRVYDAVTFELLGTAPLGTNEFVVRPVISADGTRLYTLVSNNTYTYSVSRVDVFDLTPLASGGSLVKIGDVAVSDQAQACNNCFGDMGSFNVSPLGDALFWVGNRRLVVLPLPSALAATPLAAPRRLQTAR